MILVKDSFLKVKGETIMKKVMDLEDLKKLKLESYFKVIKYFRKEVGNGSSEEAIIKYTKQASYVFDEDGTIYRRVN